MDIEHYQHLAQLLQIHRRNLSNLELQSAAYGFLDRPLRLLNELEYEKEAIACLESELTSGPYKKMLTFFNMNLQYLH